MQKLHDAVVLYNSRDVRHADALTEALRTRGVRVWYGDTGVLLGDSVGTMISDALETTRYVIACIGPNGVKGKYFRKIEYPAVLNSVAAGKYKLIPVYLGQDNSFSPDNPADGLMGGLRAADLRGGVEASVKEFRQLVERLLDRPEEPAPPEERAEPAGMEDSPAASPELLDEMIEGIMVRLEERNGLMVGIGPHWPGTGRPDSGEVALDLLSRTLNWSDDDRDLYRDAPLVHAESAALSYALTRKYNQDIAPDRITREVITPRSYGEPEAFKALAKLMQAAGQRGLAENGRAVVFTTNIDCALERAFMVSGVPFTLIVHLLRDWKDYDSKAFVISDVPVCERQGNEWRLPAGESGYAAREIGALTPEETGKYREACAAETETGEGGTPALSLPDYVRSVELSRMLAEYLKDNRETTDQILPRGTPERPVIVKLLGSHVLPRTAVISSEQHLQLAKVAQRISPVAQQLIGMNACILAGYCLCDPVFRLMFETALAECFAETSDNQDRYALLPGTGAAVSAGLAALRRVAEERVAGGTMFNMRFERGVDPELFFGKLGARVLTLSEGAWG